MNFLCVDIGTTRSKAQVFDSDGEILFYQSAECPLKEVAGEKYADILFIRDTVFKLIRAASEKYKISSVAFSSFGESFVSLGENDEILTLPMLYTDSRGSFQAEQAKKTIGEQTFYHIAGVMPAPMYSVYKLLWIKENFPHIYAKTKKIMLICDYFGYLLTNKRVIDYSLAARTGVFDIEKKVFSKELCKSLNIDVSLFPRPEKTGSIVGNISESAARETGLSTDCVLVLGSHDQVCATLGAGVIDSGKAADGMGTVECITAVFDKVPSDIKVGYFGYPVVPFLENLYCTYILNFTSGSVVDWFRKKILHGYKGDEQDVFSYLEKSGKEKTDMLVLPYFGGAATPYRDDFATGCILNLTLSSTDGEIFRAITEGTAYEMRFNLETVKQFGIEINELVATGGGSNSSYRIEIQSNVLKLPIKTLRSAEGGLCGLAMLQSVALGQSRDFVSAKEKFVRYKKEVLYSGVDENYYDNKYKKYKKLYKITKEIEK